MDIWKIVIKEGNEKSNEEWGKKEQERGKRKDKECAYIKKLEIQGASRPSF